MAQQPISTLADGHSQAKGRGKRVMYDQHNRKWFTWYEFKTGHPTGLISPMSWTAPFHPDPKYFTFPDEFPNDLVIDYDRAVADLMESHAAYRELLHRAGVHYHGEKYDPDAPPSATMLNDVGDPPFPLEVIVACQQSNGYVLGLREFDPEHAGDVRIKACLERIGKKRGILDVDAAIFADAEPVEYADREAPPTGQRRRPARGRQVA